MFTTPGDRVARLRQSYTIGGVARRSPSTVVLRETLTANRTYYVSTTGSDSNSGLLNTTAFLTIQKAIDVTAGLDLSIYTVTIEVADGTYTGANAFDKSFVGGARVIINGNSGTPANVIISTTSADCFAYTASSGCPVAVRNLKVQTTTAGFGLSISVPGTLEYQGVVFGACATAQCSALGSGANLVATGNYSITGNSVSHWQASQGARIKCQAYTVTLTGTPAFSYCFAYSSSANLFAPNNTFSGSATGTRYISEFGGVINVGGAGATYLPGNAAGSGGTTAGGGFYA